MKEIKRSSRWGALLLEGVMVGMSFSPAGSAKNRLEAKARRFLERMNRGQFGKAFEDFDAVMQERVPAEYQRSGSVSEEVIQDIAVWICEARVHK